MELGGERRAAVSECGEIGGFVIWGAVGPAGERDALPFEGESTDGGGMGFTFGDLLVEEEFGPGAVEGGLAGVLIEALMDEVRPAVASMDPVLVFAALLGDRGDAAVLLDGLGARITGALASKGAGEPRGESRTGAGEALPDGGIAVKGEALPDLPVVLLDGKAQLE